MDLCGTNPLPISIISRMAKVSGLIVSFFVIALFGVSPARSAQQVESAEFPRIPQALILSTTGQHYPAINRALATVGFQVREVSSSGYASLDRSGPFLLIIPGREGQQLGSNFVQTILHDVDDGMPLLVDGATPLNAALGVSTTGAQSRINQYQWNAYATDPVRLPGKLTYQRIKVKSRLQVLAVDSTFNSPLIVSGIHGRGRFIYSAIPLEPRSGTVFQYSPFLAQAIVDQLHVSPTLGADNLCVYVDLGGEPQMDPADIVAQLKRWSVREVHLGAFYSSDMFLEYLPRFLAAAHQQGISVYAWLEYPMVSQEFWDQHPEWREVTASGHRAIMDWRLHMALEVPACFDAVADLTRHLLLNYDWDGVDFAELYFEAERDIFKHPRDFTPMHPTFRKMFEQRYGVDPRTMFKSSSPNYGLRNAKLRSELEEFRIELITELTEKFLQTIAGCQTQKPYLRTTLTFIDALRDPTVTERYGVDPARLLALQQKYGFGVEIEDPYTVWNSSPDRYRAIGEYYRPRLQPGTPFTLDVNVVDRTPPGRPLIRPRGLELYELLANVAANVDLVTLYAYSTFSADDMRLVPNVLAAQPITPPTAADGVVSARRQLFWRTDTRGREVYLDGKKWPCASASQVLIPAGIHKVSTGLRTEGSTADDLRIENVNGRVLAAGRSGRRVSLTYESRGRCYVTLNRIPAIVLCDGAPGIGKVLSNSGQVCVVLPEGNHTVELE